MKKRKHITISFLCLLTIYGHAQDNLRRTHYLSLGSRHNRAIYRFGRLKRPNRLYYLTGYSNFLLLGYLPKAPTVTKLNLMPPLPVRKGAMHRQAAAGRVYLI